MKSTIPAPGPDTSLEARSASVVRALHSRLENSNRLLSEAAKLAHNAPDDAVPDMTARLHSERASADESYGADA